MKESEKNEKDLSQLSEETLQEMEMENVEGGRQKEESRPDEEDGTNVIGCAQVGYCR